ncbi:MAG: ribbon-helix-helix domain-containing protein [Nitrospirota bacterium]
MATILKPKSKKQSTSLALSPELVRKVDDLSRATKRSRSELAEKFLEMGLEAFEKETDTDAFLYDARKDEKDVMMKDCTDILRRIEKLAKR